jgi:FKBP-type peptidyl-prolyl cis-trans isomerase 2/predicted Fe-Mo cluster-binding NifX family protein
MNQYLYFKNAKFQERTLFMKLAVTYQAETGEVFQHFGRTEAFKLYDIEDGKIKSSQVVSTDGTGHEALAGFLADHGVSVVVCGGLGSGMMNALSASGIEVCSGASGNADDAVEAYLTGKLVNAGVSCSHHDHEDGSGHHQNHGCGHSHGEHCGHHGGEADHAHESCCGHPAEDESESHEDCCGHHGKGCCGHHCEDEDSDFDYEHPPIVFPGKNAGKKVKTHYQGTLNDGTAFDSSYDRNEPLEFIAGVGMMIPGFDKAVVDMNVGDVVNIHLAPEDAYGERDPEAVFTLEKSQLPGSEDLTIGQQIYLGTGMGQSFPVTVTAVDAATITLDANHELAGQELNFKIELLSVEEA